MCTAPFFLVCIAEHSCSFTLTRDNYSANAGLSKLITEEQNFFFHMKLTFKNFIKKLQIFKPYL